MARLHPLTAEEDAGEGLADDANEASHDEESSEEVVEIAHEAQGIPLLVESSSDLDREPAEESQLTDQPPTLPVHRIHRDVRLRTNSTTQITLATALPCNEKSELAICLSNLKESTQYVKLSGSGVHSAR